MKIKKLFLCFVLMMSMLCGVACKDKSDPETPSEPSTPAPGPAPVVKVDPTVNVSVADRLYVIGESLSTITPVLASGSTSGTVVWVDDDYILVEGENTCEWSFTPTDTESYNSKTGSLVIDAVKLETPEVVVNVVEGQTIYIDARYETVLIEATATFGGQAVEGQVVWVSPNETLDEGVNVCEWKFIPTQNRVYAEVRGTVEVTATEAQTPVAISVEERVKGTYVATDTIDKNNLLVCLVYDGGKVEEITNVLGIDVIYNEGESLQRGDTSVTVSYGAFSTQLTGLEVGYKAIARPVFNDVVVYSGFDRILTLSTDENSHLYTFSPISETNVGRYPIVVTLDDPDNYIWDNGDEITTTVWCEILKAELIEEETNCDEEFDGAEHFAFVENQTDNDIYYAETELDETNYGSASKEPIKKVNAGTYTIYYYMEGDENYNGKAGSLTIEISKQTPTMSLEYCYTIATGNVVNYPTSYVSIVDKQSNEVELSGLEFVYYTNYTNDANPENDVKTTTANGATTIGGAPKNDKTTEYYVVVKYAGSTNYNAVEAVAPLFIEGSNLELYAKSGEDKFAFKFDENGFYAASKELNGYTVSVTGSNAECENYVEFAELAVNADGLKIVEFYARFGDKETGLFNGRLVFAGGQYMLLDTNGNVYPFEYDSTNKEIDMAEGRINAVTLVKWEIPKYLKTFSAQTVADEKFNDEKNTNKNTEITFFNDYGTIRFIAKVNLPYSSPITGELGGYQEWEGVAEIEKKFVFPDGQPVHYGLNCYLVKDGVKLSSGFEVIWPVPLPITSNDTDHEPAQITIYASIGTLLSSAPESALVGQKFDAIARN
ncbi:MAG: hypothetical protein IKJ33_02980 [Clostridia bacterium]|nr:hypothetical protein [Clostridia bacterium]